MAKEKFKLLKPEFKTVDKIVRRTEGGFGGPWGPTISQSEFSHKITDSEVNNKFGTGEKGYFEHIFKIPVQYPRFYKGNIRYKSNKDTITSKDLEILCQELENEYTLRRLIFSGKFTKEQTRLLTPEFLAKFGFSASPEYTIEKKESTYKDPKTGAITTKALEIKNFTKTSDFGKNLKEYRKAADNIEKEVENIKITIKTCENENLSTPGKHPKSYIDGLKKSLVDKQELYRQKQEVLKLVDTSTPEELELYNYLVEQSKDYPLFTDINLRGLLIKPHYFENIERVMTEGGPLSKLAFASNGRSSAFIATLQTLSRGQVITSKIYNYIADKVIGTTTVCICNCNYCNCNCNYCACQCNYSCTCQCNYNCTCQCAYGAQGLWNTSNPCIAHTVRQDRMEDIWDNGHIVKEDMNKVIESTENRIENANPTDITIDMSRNPNTPPYVVAYYDSFERGQ